MQVAPSGLMSESLWTTATFTKDHADCLMYHIIMHLTDALQD